MNKIIIGNCLDELAKLPAKSVQCCVTSPPYFGLRDYGTAEWDGGNLDCDHLVGRFAVAEGGAVVSKKQNSNHGSGTRQASSICPKCGAKRIDEQIGMEETPTEFIQNLVAVFRAVRRVLRDDGTLWVNLGDSYAANRTYQVKDTKHPTNLENSKGSIVPDGLKPKDLMMMPARLALALQADGWWLRSDIIWFKTNPMPESVLDRPTSAHEHMFMLTKTRRYFYDWQAVREGTEVYTRKAGGYEDPACIVPGKNNKGRSLQERDTITVGHHMRDVWDVQVRPYKGAHFATFPEKLVEPCIKASTSEHGACGKCGTPYQRIVERGPRIKRTVENGMGNGELSDGKRFGDSSTKTIGFKADCGCKDSTPTPCVVLDPFSGSGTTGAVAVRMGRQYICIELNPAYKKLINKRIKEAKQLSPHYDEWDDDINLEVPPPLSGLKL